MKSAHSTVPRILLSILFSVRACRHDQDRSWREGDRRQSICAAPFELLCHGGGEQDIHSKTLSECRLVMHPFVHGHAAVLNSLAEDVVRDAGMRQCFSQMRICAGSTIRGMVWERESHNGLHSTLLLFLSLSQLVCTLHVVTARVRPQHLSLMHQRPRWLKCERMKTMSLTIHAHRHFTFSVFMEFPNFYALPTLTNILSSQFQLP